MHYPSPRGFRRGTNLQSIDYRTVYQHFTGTLTEYPIALNLDILVRNSFCNKSGR
jgi:hypothetical protein